MGKRRLTENAPSHDSEFADKLSRMIQPGDMKTDSYVYGVEPVDGHDAWALMCAAAAGDMPRVQALLDRDPALVNAQHSYEFPIHMAVREGHGHVVQLLLERGADPGQSRFTYSSWDKLLAVSEERGYDTVKQLLAQAMSERFNYDPEFNRVFDAVRSRDAEAVERVLDEAPHLATRSNAFGTTGLHTAALTRQHGLIDRFLELGVDINAKRSDGQTPVQYTVYGDYWDRDHGATKNKWIVVGYLLARGAYCPLTVGCSIGDVETIQKILKEDPSQANRLDSARRSPLACAAKQGYTDIVKLLLEQGADPNRPEELAPRGLALFEASARNDIEMARLLLENDADPNAGGDSSGTCSTIVEHRHPDACGPMQDLLREFGARIPTYAMALDQLKEAVRAGDLDECSEYEFLNLFGKADSDLIDLVLSRIPRAPDRLRPGGFYGVCLPEDPECVRKLLDAGLDPNRPNWIGRTFLHKEAERGDIENVKVLLEYGADIDPIELERGGTPLAGAVRKGNAEMVRFLLEQGAEASVPVDSDWATPLYWAKKGDNSEIRKLLEQHLPSG